MSNIYLIFDWDVDESHIVYRKLVEKGYNMKLIGCKQVIPNSKINKLYFIIHYFFYCLKIIIRTRKNDLLIFRLDSLGVISYWLSRLFFCHRRIIIINILLKKKNGIMGKITRAVYKKALTDKNTLYTVTSAHFGEELQKYLGIDKTPSLLRDDYGNLENLNSEFQDCGRTVFCGGNNGRDWELMMNIARHMTDVKFYIIMPPSEFEKFNNSVPQNVTLLKNIPTETFFEIQKKCSLTVLPLNTQAPAGLIVIFSAGLMEKAIITSDTVCTREYINNGNEGTLLTNDLEQYIQCINKQLSDIEQRKTLGKNLKAKIVSTFSPEKYIQTLSECIDTML